MHQFTLEYESSKKPLKPYWNMCVGSCHGTTALREDYRRQLERCQRELGFRYVRFHGLFDDDMSVLTKPMMRGGDGEEYVVSFTNIDSIFNFLLSINMKPFIEIGFMPECLKSKNTTIFHYKGNTSKPCDYERWDWLVKTFAEHLIDRYGLGEVREWFYEVWNEPNLGGPDSPFGFWSDTMEEYFNLYEHTARALKAVDKHLKVGGPATSNNAWIPEFTGFCRENNVPVDFVSTHHRFLVCGMRYQIEILPPVSQHKKIGVLQLAEVAVKKGEIIKGRVLNGDEVMNISLGNRLDCLLLEVYKY